MTVTQLVAAGILVWSVSALLVVLALSNHTDLHKGLFTAALLYAPVTLTLFVLYHLAKAHVAAIRVGIDTVRTLPNHKPKQPTIPKARIYDRR